MTELSANLQAAVNLELDRQDSIWLISLTETSSGLHPGDLDLLVQILAEATKERALKGVILHLRGGQPINPDLAEVTARAAHALENLGQPVTACLEGTVAGAIWALALASHYRFAATDVQVVLPEARYGLLTACGISQRLPRLIGAAETIRMMLEGRSQAADALVANGAIDRIVPGDLIGGARSALADGLPPRRTRDATRGFRDPKRYLTEVRAFHDRVSADQLDVSRGVVKSVEAALLLPFTEGLAFEAVTLEDLVDAPETLAVRHAILVERAARVRMRKLANRVKSLEQPRFSHLGLWEATVADAPLIAQALSRGLNICLAHADPEAAKVVVSKVAGLQDAMVARLAMSEEARDADWARLALGAEHLPGCSLVLSRQSDVPALTCPVVALGEAAEFSDLVRLLPADAAGGHAEISLPEVPEAQTDSVGIDAQDAALAMALALARHLGWRLQLAGSAGFMAPRLAGALQSATQHLIDAGHQRVEISAGLASIGLRAGQARLRPAKSAQASALGQSMMAALANEAARLMQDGVALSVEEVDAAALSAGLMPRWLGGPLYQAQARGLILSRADLARLGGTGRLVACEVFDRMISEGRQFFPTA
jgi:3-hydroxyacyl-CoA dehydrogenase